MGRPRKYATASERQAAYRERYGVRQIRLRKETLATIDDIADQLDVPSTEVVASLINFALLNYNWRTLGLFGKRLPHASEAKD